MEQFKDILKAKRKELGLTQNDFAEAVGIPAYVLSGFEQGVVPSFFKIDAIADFFECSIDELVGREGYAYTPPKKMREFKDILNDKMFERGLDYDGMAEITGVIPYTIRKWTQGDTYPNLKYLCDLADVFKCSIDELMGRKIRSDKNFEEMMTKKSGIVYSVWDNRTDKIIIIDGTAKECAKAMNMSVKSFYSTASKALKGIGKKYFIIKGE